MTNAPVPPQALEAEEHVLGAMLMSEAAIAAVGEHLEPADFYKPSHGVIYRAALDLYANGKPVDAITLVDHLDQRGELQDAGGKTRIHELALLVPASANAAHYARIVRKTAILRATITAGQEIAKLGWEATGDEQEVLEQAETLVYRLRRGEHVERPLADDIAETLTALEQLAAHPRDLLGVPTGFPDLDKVTHGFIPGNLAILAGRPSMGKTALALCISGHVAVKCEIPTVVFSLEMSKSELLHRLIALGANLEGTRLKHPWQLQADEWERVIKSASRLAQSPLTIYDDGLIRPATLRSRVRRLKARTDIGLVVVDYLQLMQADQRTESKVQEVTEISRALKITARELNVPVLALAQLSRAVEQRPDKRPVLSDLRDSGAIEQDADLVAFLYRDGYYNPDTLAGNTVELNVAKHRNGETAMVKLAWSPAKVKFSGVHLRAVDEEVAA